MLFSGTTLSLGLVTPLVCRLVWLIWFWNPLGFKFSHTTGLHTGVVDLVLAHPWVQVKLVWLNWFLWDLLGFRCSHTPGLQTGVVDLVLEHPWV